MQNDFVKIANGTYKLLEMFPDGEPLKNKAKEKVLEIMEGLMVSKIARQTLDDILVLQNYLELAKYQGWITSMNFLIIQKEYEAIKSHIIMPSIENMPPAARKSEILAKKIRHKEISKAPATVEGYSDRQRKIVKILSRKGKAQVQDIIKEMPDVTKRTIRRDLDDLLKMGHVARLGEFNQVFYQNTDRT